MRYYGLSVIEPITVLRYEAPANQYVVSLPMSYSNSTFRARTDIMYLAEDSGQVTVIESTPNTDLVGLTLQPGNAYNPEELFGNNIVKIQSGNTIPILTMIYARLVDGFKIVNSNTVTIDGSYAIQPNTYAAVVEGTITVSDTTVDSNTGLHILGKMETERTITGQGKLVTFNIINV